jgi:hypothetical protein
MNRSNQNRLIARRLLTRYPATTSPSLGPEHLKRKTLISKNANNPKYLFNGDVVGIHLGAQRNVVKYA